MDASRVYLTTGEGLSSIWLDGYERKVRQWVVMATRQHGISPTTEGTLDMKPDLSQMIDGYSGNEHALPIQPLYNDVVQLSAKTNTFYTPMLLVAYGASWSENYFYETTDVHGDQKLRRFVPHELIDAQTLRRQWFGESEYGLKGLAESAAKVVHAGVASPSSVTGSCRAWATTGRFGLCSKYSPLPGL